MVCEAFKVCPPTSASHMRFITTVLLVHSTQSILAHVSGLLPHKASALAGFIFLNKHKAKISCLIPVFAQLSPCQ